ncbi:DNA mismatch repair protein MutS [uncultured Eubacterium sp.]|uniref:DNA mismatch repair protein MutS n=1 Tax=uncultured Eubacterium sp. TaxID=165185 RepID=UPI002600ADE1|nr:DNA mismatch repair protein MutS [uncultured Eubacterium sp.]
MAKEQKLSPMMAQYFEIKKQYPGVILFFRLGDFYEMFFDDAKIASRVLDLVLTGKDCGQGERAPMCGVPFHSSDSYIAKLVSYGYKVAICEQVEDPATAKGLVKRDVVRVITPGTVIENNILDDGVNNYLCSVCTLQNETGICFVDISTGEFHITAVGKEDEQEKIINQLSTYSPKEILVNSLANELDDVVAFAKSRLDVTPEVLEDISFDFDSSTELILQTMNREQIDSLGIGKSKAAVCALGSVILYLRTNRKTDELEAPSEIEFYEETEFMSLDISARRNLELTRSMMTGDKRHSLLWVIDNTKTAMGKRMLRSWLERPLVNVSQISRRQNAVAELVDNSMLRDEIKELLTGVNDIERLLSRIAYSTANAKELRSLCTTVQRLPAIKALLEGTGSSILRSIYDGIDTLQDVYELINNAIVDEPPFSVREGGMIKAGYNEEIDSLHDIMNNGTSILTEIENREKEATGIPKLKVSYNKVFGYFIEVTNSYKHLVPETYIRKQTLTNCERYITQELKDLEGKVLGAKDRCVALEYETFCAVRSSVAGEVERIQKTAKALATLDSLASLAQVAFNNNYCCPQITTDGTLDIKDGRHPVVEALLNDTPFVPNDTLLDCSNNLCSIITGPNMAGKSTYMRQTALIVLMAQIGSFVPARSARISVCDAIFTRVGASDDLATGQSTFMVEMNEVSTILKNATDKSLIILDEIGRGTSTFDGMSIARAVLEYVVKKIGAKTLFATHYHELTAMEGMLKGVNNYSIAVKKRGDDITFLRRIVHGGADQSFGIEVAKLAGVPSAVTKRAKAILKELEANRVEIDFKADNAVEEEETEEEVQFNFRAKSTDEMLELIKAIDINTLTPIEAMQTLYDLKKRAEEIT